MQKYTAYIDNHRDGISHRCFPLGDVHATSIKKAIAEAEKIYSSDIWGFSSVYGAESTVFAIKAAHTTTTCQE